MNHAHFRFGGGPAAAFVCLLTACAPAPEVDLASQSAALTDWRRTVVFIQGETRPGQDMFVRGGIDHAYAREVLGLDCTPENGLCALPIRYRSTLNNPGWKSGDSLLDWYGAEPAQVATGAVGTPLDWTTNAWPASWGAIKRVAVDGFGESRLNDVGPHLWMLDVDMDCSRTADGWFELKSFISNGPGWEPDVAQQDTPYPSPNHVARCGQINVFARGSSASSVRDFPAAHENTWVGNATALISRGASGTDCANPADSRLGEAPIVYDSWVAQRAVARNVCFEVYKPGVTDTGDVALLETADIRVVIRYTGQEEWTPVAVRYASQAGNNARFRLDLREVYPFPPYECPRGPHERVTFPYPSLRAEAEFHVVVDGVPYRPSTTTGAYRVSFTDAPLPYEYETRCLP